MVNNSLIHWLALSLVPGLGSKSIRQLVERFGGAEEIFAACVPGSENIGKIRSNVFAALGAPLSFYEGAEAQLQALQRYGATAVCPDDEEYSALLKTISDPPPVLYLQGRVDLLCSGCVAMVGSRAATSYGRRSAFTLAKGLAAAGVTVVSGLAMGVDGEAHRGALAAGGATIGVLGCGLDVVYPRQNAKLHAAIGREGLLVSEYFLGTRPDSFRFPARNRIIAGLSRGVVVVEAAKKSGSLITAEMGLDEGREIFAVPGQIDSFKSGGTHWLLQQGARLVSSAADILDELNVSPTTGEGMDGCEDAGLTIDPDARALFAQIDVYPVPRNELIAVSGLDAAKAAELLLILELEGMVEILAGDRVRRIG